MAGILGLWNLDGRPVETSELARLSATLSHRGTDGEGLEIHGSMGLACRLSRITPEAALEIQPVVDVTGAALVFDGRLDNREELLAVLQPAADISADSSDPTLALALYRTYGDKFAERLNGDFALGLFDPDRRQILLARDAVGLRPLYFYASRDLFLFASEIKTLLAHPGVASRPADNVLADFIFNRLAATDDRGVTFFQDIFSLLPAHLGIVTREKVVTRRYWDFDPTRQVRFNSFPEYSEAFRHYFKQSVRRRLRSAGPVAVSVSGGLDSSAIFCVAETVRRSAPDRYPSLLGVSYTSPDGSPSDEQAFLLEIERAYGLEIQRFSKLPSGLMDGCREAIWHVEAPFMDVQWSGTRAFFALVRQLGARVLLTGHWGDQFLFDDAYLADLCWRGAGRTAWRHIDEYGRWLDIPDRNYFKRRLLRTLLGSSLPDAMIPTLRTLRRKCFPNREFRPGYTAQFRSRANDHTVRRAPGEPSISAHARSLYREARCRYHVLGMEWNNKVGAMHGLEMAFPFLDRDLIAFQMGIPGEIQSFMGIPKGLLREALRGVLPERIANRTSKADFTSVVNDGVAQDYEQLVDCLRAGLATTMGYVDENVMAEQLARLRSDIRSETCRVSWALGDLLALELWLQSFFNVATQPSTQAGNAADGSTIGAYCSRG